MTYFEHIPVEMMDAIVMYLDDRELLPLLLCSSALLNYTMNVLDRREMGKDVAMPWACLRGHLRVIRFLVSHGVPVSTVEIEWKDWEGSSQQRSRRSKVLTLYLAASRRQIRAFQLLIQLGARIDCAGVEKKARSRLVDRICTPTDNWALLRLFYERGLHEQICFTHYPQLERVIRRHASATTGGPVQMLLERGISPNESQSYYRHMPIGPLVAAIKLNSHSTVDLLLSDGAHVGGPNVTHSMNRPWRIPILVAAECMSINGTEMMQNLLKKGADINHSAWEHIKRIGSNGSDHYITPFLAYLDGISDWDHETHTINPIQAISFLIDQGAWVEQPLYPPFQGAIHDRRLAATRWGFEFLLRKWGPTKLHTSAGFRATIYFLLQEAARSGNLGESLARYDYALKPWIRKTDMEVPGIWEELLTYLLDVQKVDPTTLLFQYISHRGRLAGELMDIGRATVDHLLAAGANIHARLKPNGPTVLEDLCRTYSYQEHGRLEGCREFGWGRLRYRKEFICFLVDKGINSPNDAPVRAAVDLLLADLDGMRRECDLDLLSLARILLGDAKGVELTFRGKTRRL